jgi:hypothetical protein
MSNDTNKKQCGYWYTVAPGTYGEHTANEEMHAFCRLEAWHEGWHEPDFANMTPATPEEIALGRESMAVNREFGKRASALADLRGHGCRAGGPGNVDTSGPGLSSAQIESIRGTG